MGSAIDDPVSHVLDCFRLRGACNYGKEAVTQQEYALQAAYAAEQSNASAQLVAACLLHDIGHMLHDLPEDAPDHHIDDEHEQLGAPGWSITLFPKWSSRSACMSPPIEHYRNHLEESLLRKS